MIAVLSVLGGGAISTLIFVVLWKMAQADATRKKVQIVILEAALAAIRENLAALAEKASSAETSHRDTVARLNSVISDLEGRNSALLRRLAARATPETEADDIAKLFPLPGGKP